MMLAFTFSIREISEVKDSEQVISYVTLTSSWMFPLLQPVHVTIIWSQCLHSLSYAYFKVLKIPMYFTVAWEENRLKVDPSHR